MYYCAKSTHGLKSPKNEDYYWVENKADKPLYLLCDGMGGHPAGDVASKLSCELFSKHYLFDPNQALKEIAIRVNSEVFEYANTHDGCLRMGTTLLAISLHEESAEIVSVGDSRVYLFTPTDFEQLTEDQSPVWELFAQGLIEKEDILTHTKKNLIKGAIGLKQEVKVNSYNFKYPADEWIFLLCSDGLTDVTLDSEIHETLKTISTLSEGVSKLTRIAIQNKSRDDITVILVSNYIQE
jgi:protein phosphatase